MMSATENLEKQVKKGVIELTDDELEGLRGVLLSKTGSLCDEELDAVEGGGAVMAGTTIKTTWPWG